MLKTLKFGFIGAGRLGTALGYILSFKGYKLTGFHSRSLHSAQKAAQLLNVKTFTSPRELVKASDIIFLTVPDCAIIEVAESLTRERLDRKVFIHTSGAHSSEILAGLRPRGARILAFHPLQSFADIEGAIKNLPGSLISLEGDAAAVKLGKALVKVLKGKVFIIKPEDKILYHLAACITCNYLVALFDKAYELLDAIKFPPEYREALIKLSMGTLHNLRRMPPEQALTGPIARGDSGTVASHLEALQAYPEILNLYRHLGEATLGLARPRLNPEQTLVMKNLLQTGAAPPGVRKARNRKAAAPCKLKEEYYETLKP